MNRVTLDKLDLNSKPEGRRGPEKLAYRLSIVIGNRNTHVSWEKDKMTVESMAELLTEMAASMRRVPPKHGKDYDRSRS